MRSRDKFLELRAMAERLPLGEYGDRLIRDLLVELLAELAGDAVPESLTLGAVRNPAPAPDRVGVVAAVHAMPAGSTRDMLAPALGVPDPAGADWLAAQISADAKAEADAAAAAKTPPKKNDQKATPTPNGGH